MLTLKDMRSDNRMMGGTSYVAAEGKDKDWKVQAGANDITFTLKDIDGNDQTITVNAKEGDDIEESGDLHQRSNRHGESVCQRERSATNLCW